MVFLSLLVIATAAGEVDYAREIKPILARHCFLCHGPDVSSRKAKLRLDDPHSALAPREDGAAIVPGDAAASLLLYRTTHEDPDERMPPNDRPALSQGELDLLRQWIDEGANYAGHWSWQPLEVPPTPKVADDSWCRSDIDRFVKARLDAAGLAPAPEADRSTLLRRLSFDLVGLPPGADEVEAFERDAVPSTYERAVDRLLASQQFGERWGRHWLDLMRYAETCGHEFDFPIPHAWQYRDYVVRAFNADVPYDRFVMEHLAGDLLPTPRRSSALGIDESVLGTGSWTLSQGTHGPVDVRQDELDRIDNQIDVFSRSVLGTTLACARCHDHKFDPIPSSDYYSIVGMLRSSRRQVAYLDPNGDIARVRRAILDERNRVDAAIGDGHDARVDPPKSATADGAARTSPSQSFDSPLPDGWSTTGFAFARTPGELPSATLSEKGELRRCPEGIASSAAISPAMQGTLRSPGFVIEGGRIVVRAMGQGCRVRATIDGYTLDEYNALLFEKAAAKCESPDQWTDLVLDVGRYTGQRAFIEISDDGPGWIMIDEVIALADDEPLPSPPPQAWGELPPSLTEQSKSSASAALAKAHDPARVPQPMRAPALLEGTPFDESLLVRGNHRTPKSEVPRGRLTALDLGDEGPDATESERLDLARDIVARNNPLTARVMANRVWQHLIGRGIVATPDDFGTLGATPSDPTLLDALACNFRRDWSVKRFIREIVLSSTYRMASEPASADAATRAGTLDPLNEIPHCANVRRLDAECVRDAILACSGRLDRTLGGASIPIHLSDSMQGRGRPSTSGPLDGAGRRTLYLEVRRNFPVPLLAAFDEPIPTTAVGKRNESNVPAQSLALANDPFVREQAALWGAKVAAEPGTVEDRLTNMVRAALGRRPRTEELALLAPQVTPDPTNPKSWEVVALALFNAKEFTLLP